MEEGLGGICLLLEAGLALGAHRIFEWDFSGIDGRSQAAPPTASISKWDWEKVTDFRVEYRDQENSGFPAHPKSDLLICRGKPQVSSRLCWGIFPWVVVWFLGVPCAQTEVGLDDPCVSLPTQAVPWFLSMILPQN